MLVNLHTHTSRCGHAEGADEEYVRCAVDRGLQQLGFSDHAPYLFPGGYVSPVRMLPEELPNYVQSICLLREKYAKDIQLHLGVEAEYFPSFFRDTVQMLRDGGIEYMLLGQHCLGDGIGQHHFGTPTAEEAILRHYCDQVIEAMQTGLFTYLAHPDFIKFVGEDSIFNKHMRRLCREAKACDIPLEINMLGLRQGRNYPSDRFFRLVAEEGCPVVIGADAHKPEQVCLPDNEQQAMEIVNRFGLELITQPQIRKI